MVNVIAVFDIGKTNKKILLFDREWKVVYQKEQPFVTTVDEDDFECDDIDLIESWIQTTLVELIRRGEFNVVAVNFSTYGASLVYLDENGKRLTPVYNYLKEIKPEIHALLFNKNGGREEFCRITASPDLGLMLNSGIQLLWLKHEKPELFKQIASVLHFPQYISYLHTKQVVAESTSIGCHTFLWDFDHHQYHPWLINHGIKLPVPIPTSTSFSVEIEGKTIAVGVGVHDSSASLVPYLLQLQQKFLLLSTGTWCICMNPFNNEPLTAHQLENDCLTFLNVQQKPVKASRLFMGHIHDVNVAQLVDFFKIENDAYKKVKFQPFLLKDALIRNEKKFFRNGVPYQYVDVVVDLNQFPNFEAAYHQFIFDLAEECIRSMRLVIPTNDNVEAIIVSGGFARNEIFIRYLASKFPDKAVYTSHIDNSSALGAAMVMSIGLSDETGSPFNLNMKQW